VSVCGGVGWGDLSGMWVGVGTMVQKGVGGWGGGTLAGCRVEGVSSKHMRNMLIMPVQATCTMPAAGQQASRPPTMARFWMLCMPRMADWGGLMMGVDSMEPYTPPLLMVKVPPAMSSMEMVPSRAFLPSRLMFCGAGAGGGHVLRGGAAGRRARVAAKLRCVKGRTEEHCEAGLLAGLGWQQG
jgi:hypothetical protein